MLERVLAILHLKPRQISSEERKFQLEEVFSKEPFTNQVIWFAILAGESLGDSGVQLILDSYKEYKTVYPDDNPPVTIHLQRAGIGINRLYEGVLNRATFNYDEGLQGPDRLRQALQELQDGKRISVALGNREYQSVEEMAQSDLRWFRELGMLRVSQGFDQQTQTREAKYILNCSYTDGMYVYGHRLERYKKEVLPLLEPGQVIKPSEMYDVWNSKPAQIVPEQVVVSIRAL